jgi:alcohol dehydrogenase (cytochrome c)
MKRKLLIAWLLALPVVFPISTAAQGVDAAMLLKPLGDSWPTYSGDYSGRRYSTLTQLNQSNVKNLTLAWVSRVATNSGNGGRGGATIIGGEGT